MHSRLLRDSVYSHPAFLRGPPQLPGIPSYLRPGTPAVAKVLLDLGYTTGEFCKNHLGDHTESLPTAHGFQEYFKFTSQAHRDASPSADRPGRLF